MIIIIFIIAIIINAIYIALILKPRSPMPEKCEIVVRKGKFLADAGDGSVISEI